MTLFDFRTENEELYSPSPRDFTEVDVPVFSYFMVDGDGESTNAPSHGDAVAALLAASDAARALSATELGRDYVVGPLEGLWYAEHLVPFTQVPKSEWLWTMMIRQPEWLPRELMDAAIVAGNTAPRAGVALRHARLHRRYLPQHGLVENGRHHEIYLNCPGSARKRGPDATRRAKRTVFAACRPDLLGYVLAARR